MIVRKVVQPSVVSSSFKRCEPGCNHFCSTIGNSIMEKYDEAIAALNSLQSNFSVIQEVAKKINESNSVQSDNLHLVRKYLERCNIKLDNLSKKIIHVSGTKGKGSTCALTESILRHHGYSTGFFSSPHLFSVTERIRLNGKPISHHAFTSYFWEIYQKLDNNKETSCDMPGYFKFLTILAFHIFIQEKVDVAIIEVGIGGEYDCTNVIQNTPVVGITSLGFDHMSILGSTIESIAWMKGGVMKKGCLAITCSDQSEKALEILKERAKERESYLSIIERDITKFQHHNPMIALNASLAVHLAHSWMNMQQTGVSSAPEDIRNFKIPQKTTNGILNCLWYGRFQILPISNINFFLDGAHTTESILYCTQWFQMHHNNNVAGLKKVLIFNLTSQRNPEPLLESLLKCGFRKAFFSPNIRSEKKPIPNDLKLKSVIDKSTVLSSSLAIQEKWKSLNGCESEVTSCVSEAIDKIKQYSDKDAVSVLVTGSVHLVGNVLSLLQPDLWSDL